MAERQGDRRGDQGRPALGRAGEPAHEPRARHRRQLLGAPPRRQRRAHAVVARVRDDDARRPRRVRPRRQRASRARAARRPRRCCTSRACKAYDDIHAVIHCHAKFCTMFAVTAQPIPCVIEEVEVFVGGDVRSPTTARRAPTSSPTRCAKWVGDRGAVLMANHGLLTVGKDPKHAMHVAKLVERTARDHLGRQAARRGGPDPRRGEQDLRGLLPLRPDRQVLTERLLAAGARKPGAGPVGTAPLVGRALHGGQPHPPRRSKFVTDDGTDERNPRYFWPGRLVVARPSQEGEWPIPLACPSCQGPARR